MGDDVVAANGRQVRLAKITVLKLKHPLGRTFVCCLFCAWFEISLKGFGLKLI